MRERALLATSLVASTAIHAVALVLLFRGPTHQPPSINFVQGNFGTLAEPAAAVELPAVRQVAVESRAAELVDTSLSEVAPDWRERPAVDVANEQTFSSLGPDAALPIMPKRKPAQPGIAHSNGESIPTGVSAADADETPSPAHANSAADPGARRAPLAGPTNLPPAYPRSALAQRREGTVVLRLTIDEAGAVTRVAIAQTSGHADLDEAATAAAARWKYSPGFENGRAVECELIQPIPFRLKPTVGN